MRHDIQDRQPQPRSQGRSQIWPRGQRRKGTGAHRAMVAVARRRPGRTKPRGEYRGRQRRYNSGTQDLIRRREICIRRGQTLTAHFVTGWLSNANNADLKFFLGLDQKNVVLSRRRGLDRKSQSSAVTVRGNFAAPANSTLEASIRSHFRNHR